MWTRYTYDASGRTLTVTAPDGGSTSYAYQGNQNTITDPAGKWKAGTVYYSYNDDGTLQSKTDAMGQQTQYTYDALARVIQASYLPNGQNEDLCQRVTYEYDNAHNDGTSANPIGRLTGMSWSGGPSCIYGFQEEYTYDAQGRVWERILTMTNAGSPGVTPITLASYFQYDAEGRLTVSQYPAGTTGSPNATTTYTTEHDALGRQSDLYSGTPQQPTPVVSNVTYNAAGQLTGMSTGVYTETRQYNANLQLIRLTATPTGGGGIDFSYTYPASGNNGRISQMTDNIAPGEQVSYTYDQLNRLVQSVSSVTGTMPFAYDGFGNLTQQGQTTLSIDPTTNRINSAGYQYNANGNVTQTPDLTTYSYDVANRLVSNNAIYNPRNQRVFDGTYIYLYTPEGKLVGKYTPAWRANGSGSQAIIQGSQPNAYFAGKLIQEQGQWVMTDRLGSVRLHATNGRSSYLPYGAEVTQTSDQRTKFATYYRDSAGLDYAGQRYYSNVTGRFLTPDPSTGVSFGDPGSWNKYAYVQGDPVNFRDPHGLLISATEGGGEPDDQDVNYWNWVMRTQWYSASMFGGGGVAGSGDYTPGGGGGASYRPECDRSVADNVRDLDFIQAHLADATKLATELGVTVSDVLAVSAEETTWGSSNMAQHNNFFGLHGGADTFPGQIPGREGVYWTRPTDPRARPVATPVFSAATGYYDSGEVFVNREKPYVSGNSDPTAFATILHQHGYGVGTADYVSTTVSVIKQVATRIDCPK